jgi:L-type amino acid transporter 5
MPSHNTKVVKSTTEDMLLSPAETPQVEVLEEKVKMKKQLGLLEGVAIILGIIFGSGIFISPKGIIQQVSSVGFSLVIWVMCGLLSMIGALCYAELGTTIPKSGGDYAYIYEAYGPLPSFLYLWAANLIFVPTTNAIMGMTFAEYVIQPFFYQCDLPLEGAKFVAAATICFLTFLNGYNVKATTKIQNVFMFCKIGALVLVIITGVVWMGLGHVENFDNAFAGTTTNVGKIANGFYSGIFSYSGWNYLNFMTEELKNPYVNLPRAIYISLPLVTIIYVLANMAYLSVLTPVALVSSDAIAVTFANNVLGQGAWIIPVMVAISAFGGLSVHIMTSSRMLYVGARNGHFPAMLSHLNVNKLTPMPSLVFLVSLITPSPEPMLFIIFLEHSVSLHASYE